jgi:hypothetical protein
MKRVKYDWSGKPNFRKRTKSRFGAADKALLKAISAQCENIAGPSQGKINVLPCWHSRAGVAELVDALDLGSSG